MSMNLLSPLGRLIGSRVRSRSRGVSSGLVLAAVVLSTDIAEVGTAHAQSCDPVEAAKPLMSDGAKDGFFDDSISISSDTAVIGACGDDDNGSDSGSAWP